VGCFEGFTVRGGAEGVGKSTTASVVNSIIMVIAADVVFTTLFYYTGG
jgi:phospholipid/cholesterol/gamma-HCH transport system permease protein